MRAGQVHATLTQPPPPTPPIHRLQRQVAAQTVAGRTGSNGAGVTAAEPEVDAGELLTCETAKGTGKERKMTRSAGALFFTFRCGVTFFFRELYGTEALSQVAYGLLELLDLAEALGVRLPLTACYDDACHLVLYLLRRQHPSARAQLLALIDWTVDRFHFPNHK